MDPGASGSLGAKFLVSPGSAMAQACAHARLDELAAVIILFLPLPSSSGTKSFPRAFTKLVCLLTTRSPCEKKKKVR